MSSSVTVRIDTATHAVLHELAELNGCSMQAVLASAIEKLRRDYFLDRTNAAYERMQYEDVDQDQAAWEQAFWDSTLKDALPQ